MGGEPLALECRHFIECVLDGLAVHSSGESGLKVVRILEAGQKSLKSNGEAVELDNF